MILRKNEVIPYETTGGLDTVAIRMPSHPVARRFLQDSGCMIAAPSANIRSPEPDNGTACVGGLTGQDRSPFGWWTGRYRH